MSNKIEWIKDELLPSFDFLSGKNRAPTARNTTPNVVEIGSLFGRISTWCSILGSMWKGKPRISGLVVRDVSSAMMELEPTDGPLTSIMRRSHGLITGVSE